MSHFNTSSRNYLIVYLKKYCITRCFYPKIYCIHNVGYNIILSIILIVKSNFNIPFLRLSCQRCYHSLWCIPWVLCLIVSEKELELPTSLTFVGPWVRKSFGCFLWTVPTLYRLVLPMLCLFLYPSAFYLSAVQIW